MQERKSFIINAAYYGIILIIVLAACTYVLPNMIPFIVAFAVAAILQIPISKMKLKNRSLRRIAAIVLCSVFYAVVLLVIVLVGTRLIREAGELLKAIPSLFNQLVPLMEQVFNSLETAVLPYDSSLAKVIDEMATSTLKTVGSAVTSLSGRALLLVTGYATAIPGLLVKTIITVISTFFMAIDFDRVIKFLYSLVPKRKRELVDTSVQYTKSMIFVYVKSYAMLFLLTFVELTIGFTVLRIPYAILLAMLISIFDLMPILGTGGILLPWALILVALGNIRLAIGILALYVIITAVRQTLEPRIVGKQIGLHPLATLIAMVLGLGMFGIVGMFVFPVTLAVASAMRRTSQATKESQGVC